MPPASCVTEITWSLTPLPDTFTVAVLGIVVVFS